MIVAILVFAVCAAVALSMIAVVLIDCMDCAFNRAQWKKANNEDK